MRLFIEKIWNATRRGIPLTRRAYFFWYILKLLQYIYVFGLFLRRIYHYFLTVPQVPYNIPVIAVGNLSLGGTGKSVFVQWLVQQGGFQNPAVLLRGYKSKVLLEQKNFVVSDGKSIFGEAAFVGDESLQIALFGVAVAIGKNRLQSLTKLLQKMTPNVPDVVILDDAYQTNSIKKTFTILLVDAQAPFENGNLFPAGPLRELDYSRADVIVLTHADRSSIPISEIKSQYFIDFDPDKIFSGRHAFTGFFDAYGQKFFISKNNPIILCSGIAKPDSLEGTIRQQGFVVSQHVIFFDHHAYEPSDVYSIIDHCKKNGVDICVTTEKDWTKLSRFQDLFVAANIHCVVAKIAFEFLTVGEYAIFVNQMQKAIERGLVAQ